MERSNRYSVLGLTAGIACGFLLCLWSKPICLKQKLREEVRYEMHPELNQHSTQHETESHKQVLIGVMTAAKFIDNRARAVWKTWAQQINGDVVFFSSEGSQSKDPDLPLVALPRVTDVYTPLKKSFMMLKYLHDYGADKYRFFMRVDDDVYIHPERLSKFLASLNHTKALYLGQPGTGSAEDVGRLSLKPDENFCMGGPGVVFSAETLRKTVPHISYCLKHLLTSLEDVELGRCVTMFAGISCSWNYEMQQLFHHSRHYKTDNQAFPNELNGIEMQRAITLHPIKDPQVMYKVHNQMKIDEREHSSAKHLGLSKELEELNSVLDKRHSGITDRSAGKTSSAADVIPWKFITTEYQYSHDMLSVKQDHDGARKILIQKALVHVQQHYNKNAYYIGRTIDDPKLVYGYHRNHPTRGTQLFLYINMTYVQRRGKHTKTPVFIQVMIEQPYSTPVLQQVNPFSHKLVHLILPLSGKLEAFKRFLTRFSSVCGETKLCKLIVSLYPSPQLNETLSLIKNSQYSHAIQVLAGKGEFSRAQSKHRGVEAVTDEDLVMFIDVDMHFTNTAMRRVQQHTILGQQAYFPIVFSQYDSHIVCGSDSCPVFDQSQAAGQFRYFGFGITSMYKADYLGCGGFDLSIRGWGKEDVDLYSKMLKTKVEVFRAADPDLIHIYHEKLCDASLAPDQKVMCINSKASWLASQHTLAKLYYKSL